MSVDNLLPYALTTLARVKDRIYDTNTGASQPTAFDNVLTRMINSATDFFESECGGRRFVLTTHTNNIYSSVGPRQKRVVTRQAPIIFEIITGDTVAGSTTISNISSTTSMIVGMPIAGDNLAATYISNGNQLRNAIASIGTTSITIQAAATSTQTGAIFQVNGLFLLQWRAGNPVTAPSWTNFLPDQYEIVNNGQSGVIRLYGFVPTLRENMIRIKYTSGYAVDWANAGNGTTHKLPASISDTIENMVVRKFKRRMLAGKQSEALDGATTSWKDELDSEDKGVISQFFRMPTIF